MPVKNESRQGNKLQWFLFVIAVPIIFAIIIGMVILNVTGINATEKVKELGHYIPFIDTSEEEQPAEREVAYYEATIKERDTKIDDLEVQLTKKDDQIENLKGQIESYQQQLEEMKESNTNQQEEMKKLTNSFKDMEPSKAADILVAMNQGHAIELISNLQDDIRGAILSEMDAENAAVFTNSLME